MARILIVGAGVCGLAAATLLAQDGHEVIVLERDNGSVPLSGTQAWERWGRHGVAQFRQPHGLHAGASHHIDTHLPGVNDELAAAGALRLDQLHPLPPPIADIPSRPGDDRFVTLTARRPVLEYAFASVAGKVADIRRGITATELLTGPSALPGVPHVTGLRTADGEHLDADLVVDASGRRSVLPRWLTALGARPPVEEADDSRFFYYTRYFHSPGGHPEPRIGLLTPLGSISLLTLPADNNTWSVTIYTSSKDRVLREVRRPDVWANVIRACPLHEHWLDGEPITDVLPMSGTLDRYRRFSVDSVPVATGVVALGDAWACSNPSVGRGIPLGLRHAVRLRDVVRAELGDPVRLAETWDAVTDAELAPWYRATLDGDRDRLAEIEAIAEGRPVPPPRDEAAAMRRAMLVAMAYDGDVFRAFLDIFTVTASAEEVFTRPGLADRIATIAENHDPMEIPGPTRQELLELAG
jgi:2-polyprenyl-6-methoxyphenol hydroxylase-like FAD-dependent oxidoreductase